MGDAIRVLGLTGGIASGKSTVAKMFAELGAEVLNADDIAREVVAPGSETLAQVVDAFGAEVLLPDGRLDREQVGEKVFSDPEARRRLEAILHPAIKLLSEARLAKLRQSQAPLVIYEAPLLFEAGAEDRVDAVLMIAVDEEEQLRRLVERDGLSMQDAQNRVDAQMPQSEKTARSDFVIDSGCSLEELKERVMALFKSLTSA